MAKTISGRAPAPSSTIRRAIPTSTRRRFRRCRSTRSRRAGSDRAGSSQERNSRPKTELGKYANIELTSIINMMDIENREGAKPLVDLNVGPQLDSAPLPDIPKTVRHAAPPPAQPPQPLAPPQTRPIAHQPYASEPAYPRAPIPGAALRPPVRAPTAGVRRRRRSPIQPWIVVVAILLVAG